MYLYTVQYSTVYIQYSYAEVQRICISRGSAISPSCFFSTKLMLAWRAIVPLCAPRRIACREVLRRKSKNTSPGGGQGVFFSRSHNHLLFFLGYSQSLNASYCHSETSLINRVQRESRVMHDSVMT